MTVGFDPNIAPLQQATEADYERLLDIWTTVFTQPRSVFDPQYQSVDPERRFCFFYEWEGQIVSSVQTYLLPVRDESGAPVLVASIANVSTRPEFRGFGLSFSILARTVEESISRGAAWSYLFTGIHSHYAKHGWKTVDGKVWKIPTASLTDKPSSAEVLSTEDLTPAIEIHSKGTTHAPLAMVRGEMDWSIKVPSRVHGRKLVLIPGVAYAIVHPEETEAIINEWATLDPSRAIYESLLCGAGVVAANADIPTVRVAASITPEAAEACQALADSQYIEQGMGMVRPIAPDWSDQRLIDLFGRPDAKYSGLDTF